MYYIKLFILCSLINILLIAQEVNLPYLKIDSQQEVEINKVFRIAVGDIITNTTLYQRGILEEESPCLMAGLDYDKPWTRDAAINVYNGFCFINPDAAKNTLNAQLEYDNEKIIIGGQYWDNVIWAIGAWQYYLVTGDEEFLKLAYKATSNTVLSREIEEYDPAIGLFRGPAVYGDGVAAYPKIYTEADDPKESGTYSGVYYWAEVNKSRKAKIGYGMPMFTLSTNCVYYKAYTLLDQMSMILKEQGCEWNEKSGKLKKSINKEFWNPEKGIYNYLKDPFGGCDYQESLGNAFAVLFDVADKDKKETLFQNIVTTENGIACVYPAFPRYRVDGNYGRHSGTVWTHIQGFWAQAAMLNGRTDLFCHEFYNLTNKAFRDKQFVEIYHPETGLQYGGLQEPSLKEKAPWDATNIQAWSATAYLNMVLYGILGIQLNQNAMKIEPNIPFRCERLVLSNLYYHGMKLNIEVIGEGNTIKEFYLDGHKIEDNIIRKGLTGDRKIKIIME